MFTILQFGFNFPVNFHFVRVVTTVQATTLNATGRPE